MKYLKAQIICQKFVEEFVLKTVYEGNCVIEQSGHGTVTIGSIEKYINDTAWEKGWVKPIKVKKELKQTVGIIGSPAGMACAELENLAIKLQSMIGTIGQVVF